MMVVRTNEAPPDSGLLKAGHREQLLSAPPPTTVFHKPAEALAITQQSLTTVSVQSMQKALDLLISQASLFQTYGYENLTCMLSGGNGLKTDSQNPSMPEKKSQEIGTCLYLLRLTLKSWAEKAKLFLNE